MSFILVIERKGYDPDYFGPFETEEDAMSWMPGPPEESSLWRVTTMSTPGASSKIASRDEMLQGWRALPNGDMVKGAEQR